MVRHGAVWNQDKTPKIPNAHKANNKKCICQTNYCKYGMELFLFS